MIRSGSFGALSPGPPTETRSQSVREQRSVGNISWSDDYGISIERKGRSLSPRAPPHRGMPPKAMSARDVMMTTTTTATATTQNTLFPRGDNRASLLQATRRSASERDLYAIKGDDGEGNNGTAGFDFWNKRGSRTEIPEKDLFASVKMLEEDDVEYYSDGELSSSTTTSGSVDSFGVESVEDIHSRRTEAHRNSTQERNHDHTGRQGGVPRSRYTRQVNSYEDYDEDDDVLPDGGGLSLSIMSLNSVPFAIREERSGEEHDDTNGDQEDVTTLRRSQRSSVSSPLLSTPVAYLTLMDEYEVLLDQIEELEAVSERRKSEKNQLHKLVLSKEEEYAERRQRLERFQSRIEALEVELMTETTSSHNNYEKAMQPWRRKQKQAWEDLDVAITQLDLLRSENKSFIDLLQERPVVAHDDAALELDLQKRRKKTKQLEGHLVTLKEDVNRLRGRKKALLDQHDTPALIGKEIVCDEKEHASVTSLTVNS